MTHIEFIMGSSSGYLFFVLPSLAYLTLFIFLEMKMLFLVWKSHNLETLDHPQMLRKRLTSFYFQFYLGLFAFLSLNYFFGFEAWMILLRNLILIPQIIHNVRLGHKPLFNPFYVFGFIGSRLLIPIYERTCPENRFKLAPNSTLVFVLVTVFVCEVILLVLQNRLGSRFFVPKRFLPNYY
jgi:transmembrane E3 ubiquitin-protein ligase